MNRSILERELKKVGISLNGWLPVLQCDTCNHRWKPFNAAVGPAEPTAKLNYWMCPNQCNAANQVSREVQAVVPRYLVINDVPGMIFGDEDTEEFERYVRSMDATIVPGR